MRAKINFREKEKEVLDQILGNAGRYDARIRPSGVNGTGQSLNAGGKCGIMVLNIPSKEGQVVG